MARVFWIGIGKMGFPMAMNLLAAGNEVVVYDLNRSQLDAASAKGARPVGSVAEGMAGAEFIFTMVPTSTHLCDIVLGDDGIAACATPGQIVVDTSTVSVAASRECGAALAAAGAQFVRSAVNGSTIFAEQGALTVIASGPKPAYEKALPLLEKLSKTRFYLGPGDEARLMKLAVNMIIGATLEVFAEAAVLCEKGGIDWNTAMDVFAGSSIASPQILFKLPSIREKDYSPASYITTAVKDSVMALEAAKELGVYVPVSAATMQMYEACVACGKGDKDFAAVIEIVEQMSGM